jgi:hypothetical protein
MQVVQSSMHTRILFAKLECNYCCEVEYYLENKKPWVSHLACSYNWHCMQAKENTE